jgi:hypothetical protein
MAEPDAPDSERPKYPPSPGRDAFAATLFAAIPGVLLLIALFVLYTR